MTRAERKHWLRTLSDWLSPAVFGEHLDRLLSEHGLSVLLTDPRAGFFRDAYCAREFAVLRGAQRVRLVANPRPDFEVEIAGITRAYEFTEADLPYRRRGDEIRAPCNLAAGEPTWRAFPEEEWLTPTIADAILQKASELKNSDRYEPHWGLLILLNPVEFGSHQQAVESLMAGATKAVKNRFAEIWVLWKGVAYNAWTDGVCGSRVIASSR